MKKNRLLPICRFLSRQSFLAPCRNSGLSVATGVGLGQVFLGCDKGFLSHDRASGLYVTTWFSLCRNMVFLTCDRFGLAWDFYVTTEHFCVATESSQG